MPEEYFIIDANVVISIAVFSSYKPAECLKKIFSTGTLVFSEAILLEYAETLSSHKFDKYISSETRLQFLEN